MAPVLVRFDSHQLGTLMPVGGHPRPERGRVLTNEELICEHAARVGAHWSGRPCLLDTRFLGAALDASEAPAWLPALFDAVDRKRGRAIPVTDLSAQPGEVEGTARVLTKQRHGLALRVTLLDLADATLAQLVRKHVARIGADAGETILLLDLSEAGFSDAQAIAGAIAEYAHRLQAISKWRRIIFEGSNFPDKNTAPKNGITRVRRNEWLAWRNTVICAKAYTLAILQLITAPSSSKENVAVAVRYRISAMH